MGITKYLILTVAVIGFTMAACSPTLEEEKMMDDGYITVTPTTHIVGLEGGEIEISIKSNAVWEIRKTFYSWIIPSAVSGEGDASVTIKCEASGTGSERTGNLIINAKGVKQSVTVKIVQKKVDKPAEPDKPQEPEQPSEPEGPTIPDSQIPADYSRLTAENHPRLFFKEEDFSAIKSGSAGSPVFKTFHNQLISAADSYIGAEALERTADDQKRILSISRKAMRRLTSCAYAYKTTGDSKYLSQAETDLKAVCNFSDWNHSKHFLDVAEMAAGVGIAYDWLYNELSAENRKLVTDKLTAFAFSPAINGFGGKDFYKAMGNWNQVCNGGLITAALAAYESCPLAGNVISKGIETNKTAMEEIYFPDGTYPEGYGYWGYGTGYEALLLGALETTIGTNTGLSEVTGFDKTGKYMLFMEGCLKMCFNYSDTERGVTPAMAQWYLAYKFRDLSNLYLEKNRLSSYREANESQLLCMVAYYAYKLNLSSLNDIEAPTQKVYYGGGETPVAMVHTEWTMDSSDKYLGIKGGCARTGHGHLDAGSFVYEAYGVRWAEDMRRRSYAVLEGEGIDLWNMNDGSTRWDEARFNNKHHNTLTINGKYHKVDGFAAITEIMDYAAKKGCVVDITEALGGEVASAVRTIYIEGEDLVITDNIQARQDSEADVVWTWSGRPKPSISGNNIILTSRSVNIYMKKTASEGCNPQWWCASDNNTDIDGNYVNIDKHYECGYRMTVTKGKTVTVTVRVSKNPA